MIGMSNMISMIIGIFFGSVVGFLLCLGLMFWFGVIGNDIREFVGAQIDELLTELNRANRSK